MGHYMNAYPEISRRVRDKYHNLERDEMVKTIFNSGKNKVGVGMKISSWMTTDEMKLIENYRMYAEVFGTRFLARKKFNVLAQHLQEVIEESLPNMVDDRVKELTKTQVPIYVVGKGFA
ncbi:hypothetical protein Tco_0291757 [Tanacetum coccineum]